MTRFAQAWTALRGWIEWLNGDAAYRAYRAAWQASQAECAHAPMSRAAFYRAEIERRWNGVRRCC